MSTLKNLKKGDEGYEYFESLFENMDNYSLLKGSPEQDQHQGIDCFIVNAGDQSVVANIDVKNTHDLYFLNYFPDSKHCSVRHPLRTTSKTTHVAVVSTNKAKEGFYGFYTMRQWVGHFIKESAVDAFLNELKSIETSRIDEYIGATKSTSQAVYKLKLALQPYLKEDCYISYEEPAENEERISFKIYSSRSPYKIKDLTEESIKTINDEKEIILEAKANYKPEEKYYKITL